MLRWVGICGMAAVTVLLSCCTSGGGAPAAAPTPPVTTPSTPPVANSSTVAPTPTGPKTTGPGVLPGEQPPVMPAAAKEHTPAGALAFAAYYVHALDWSFATTDGYLLRNLSTTQCTICAEHVAALDTAESTHQRIEGGRALILKTDLLNGTANIDADEFIKIESRQDPGRVVDADGKTVKKIAGGTASNVFYLRWDVPGWRIVAIGKPS